VVSRPDTDKNDIVPDMSEYIETNPEICEKGRRSWCFSAAPEGMRMNEVGSGHLT